MEGVTHRLTPEVQGSRSFAVMPLGTPCTARTWRVPTAGDMHCEHGHASSAQTAPRRPRAPVRDVHDSGTGCRPGERAGHGSRARRADRVCGASVRQRQGGAVRDDQRPAAARARRGSGREPTWVPVASRPTASSDSVGLKAPAWQRPDSGLVGAAPAARVVRGDPPAAPGLDGQAGPDVELVRVGVLPVPHAEVRARPTIPQVRAIQQGAQA